MPMAVRALQWSKPVCVAFCGAYVVVVLLALFVVAFYVALFRMCVCRAILRVGEMNALKARPRE